LVLFLRLNWDTKIVRNRGTLLALEPPTSRAIWRVEQRTAQCKERRERQRAVRGVDVKNEG
jgi:hypothetical protein